MFTFSPNTRIKSSQVNQNFTDLSTGDADTDANRLAFYRAETAFDFVQSGLLWSQVSGLNGTVTAGVAYIANPSNDMPRLAVASIASKTFTASKDTYVDIDYAGAVYYGEVANGATAPTLSANRMRIALVITNGSAIANVYQTDQRQANSIPADLGWSGLDNIGNPVRNTSPFEMEFRVTRHNGTAARTVLVAAVLAVIPNMTFNYKTGRSKEKITFDFGAMRLLNATGTHQLFVYVDGNPLYPHIYQDITGGHWFTGQLSTLPLNQNASTSAVVTLRGSQTQQVNYVNATGDGSYQMPTVTMKVKKAA